MDVAKAADLLADAAHELLEAWDADSGKFTDRLISALTELEIAHEDYTFIRHERAVQAKR